MLKLKLLLTAKLPSASASICTLYVNVLVEFGDNIQDPTKFCEAFKLLDCILNDALSLEGLGSPIPTAASFSVNLKAQDVVVVAIPTEPVASNNILLLVEAGVIAASRPVIFVNAPDPVTIAVNSA